MFDKERCNCTDRTDANNSVSLVLQNFDIDIPVYDSESIIKNINDATSRKYHAHDGDIRIMLAIHNYCYHRFHHYHKSHLLDDITDIEHHLRSNALFATWFDKFDMALLLTNNNLKRQIEGKDCIKLKGTLFEAFLSLIAKDKSKYPSQDIFNMVLTTILNSHFDFEEYLRYKNHTYMDTLHLPYKLGYDYKKEFIRVTNKLFRTIPFHSFPVHYDEKREMYSISMNTNPLLDSIPDDYTFTCSFKKKNSCVQYTIYHFLKELAIFDQNRTT